MKKRQLIGGLLAAVFFAFIVSSPAKAAQAELPSYATVHDPSIVYCEEDGNYYIFGSHQAVGRSQDLINWNNVSGFLYEEEAEEELAESLKWAGYKDGSVNAGNGLALWASCVIYNPYYEKEDGSLGSYMIYYPASSDYKKGCIGYAVSPNIASGYTYVDTVMYSGFTQIGECGDEEAAKTSWENTNLSTWLHGGKMPFNEEWFTPDGGYNIGSYPQAIDPTVFFDKEEQLWLLYGSHGGGIWLLPLDRTTGQPVFLTEEQVAKAGEKGQRADCYFGYQVTSEGEGAFLLYDDVSGYYYLTVTYGQITDGYNMRLFRSEEVTGVYTDCAGNEAVYKEVRNQDSLGVKLMGNYQLDATANYSHGGHNSLLSVDGELFNMYHQRFGDNDSYSDRIHQMFRNEKGWLCMAVYQYAGDKIAENGYAKEEIVGSYQFLNHGTATSSSALTVYEITLSEDGTLSGDFEGTWEMTEGTCYMAIQINGVTYDGVFFKQQDESGAEHRVMTFTAVGENNETIWGSRLEEEHAKRQPEESVQSPVYAYPFTVTDGYLTMNEGMLTGAGVLTGNAVVTEDETMGLCLKSEETDSFLKVSSDAFYGIKSGMSITFWAKAEGGGTLFSSASDNLSIAMNEKLETTLRLFGETYEMSGKVTGEEWNYIGLNISPKGMELYVNGEKAAETEADFSEMFDGSFMENQQNTFGSGRVYMDDIEVYAALLSETDYQQKYSTDNVWTSEWHIDFGPEGSPQWDVFTMMYNTTLYSKGGVTQGYGFTEEVDAYETSAGGNKIRDFVYKAGGQPYTFQMDLPNGTYSVFVYSGNKEAENTLNFYFNEDSEKVYTQITPEGVASDNYDGENTYEVFVTEELLSITFWGDESLGAEAVTGALNSLEIVKISDEYPTDTGREQTEETDTAKGDGEAAENQNETAQEKQDGIELSTILLILSGIAFAAAAAWIIWKRKNKDKA